MPEKTEAQKRAQKNYMDKFAIARVRMEKTRYEAIQAAAAAAGESVNAYINGAIDTRMEEEARKGPQEVAGAPSGMGVVSLPSGTIKTAPGASEGQTEEIPDGD